MKMIFILMSMLTATTLFSQAPSRGPIRFLALGDSYTIGESVDEKDRWPVQLAAALRNKGIDVSDPTIIATTGWRTDDLKNAILKASPPKDFGLVSLLIGVNNQYQGKTVESYVPEFEELLLMAIRFAGGQKERVFVVSIPDYGYTPFGKEKRESISKAIDEYNAANRQITEKHGVRYFYITDISRIEDSALVASDNLHPSGKMYAAWVERILDGL